MVTGAKGCGVRPAASNRNPLRTREFPLGGVEDGQGWQVEGAFGRNERRLGSALPAASWGAQQCEVHLRALAHDLTSLERAV